VILEIMDENLVRGKQVLESHRVRKGGFNSLNTGLKGGQRVLGKRGR